jgi:hypothetical protein
VAVAEIIIIIITTVALMVAMVVEEAPPLTIIIITVMTTPIAQRPIPVTLLLLLAEVAEEEALEGVGAFLNMPMVVAVVFGVAEVLAEGLVLQGVVVAKNKKLMLFTVL